jgi:DNA-binding response OmpR family regulator
MNNSQNVVKILVLEDEPGLLETTVTFLNLKGFMADGVSTIKAAEQWMKNHVVDILILDLGLGDEDGLEWLKSQPGLKKKGLIITSARTSDVDRLAGAIAGADVYLLKPVLLDELVATLHNLIRRLQIVNNTPWLLNKLTWTLNSPDHQSIKLTHFEVILLSNLMAGEPGEVITKETIIKAMGHDFTNYDPKNLETLISRLRSKVKQQCNAVLPLQTAHGKGYAFTGQIHIIH